MYSCSSLDKDARAFPPLDSLLRRYNNTLWNLRVIKMHPTPPIDPISYSKEKIPWVNFNSNARFNSIKTNTKFLLHCKSRFQDVLIITTLLWICFVPHGLDPVIHQWKVLTVRELPWFHLPIYILDFMDHHFVSVCIVQPWKGLWPFSFIFVKIKNKSFY